MTDFGYRYLNHADKHQDGGTDQIDCAGLDGRVNFEFGLDPVVPHFSTGDFTTDGAWHDLDLSAIVPGGTKAVLVRLQITDNATASYFKLREKGNSNEWAVIDMWTQVVNVAIMQIGIVPCDTQRVIQYGGKNLAFSAIYLTIIGYFR